MHLCWRLFRVDGQLSQIIVTIHIDPDTCDSENDQAEKKVLFVGKVKFPVRISESIGERKEIYGLEYCCLII